MIQLHQLHLHVKKALIILPLPFYLFSISDYLKKGQLTFIHQFDFHSYHSINHAMLSIIHKNHDH